jgi:dTMP kinase
MTGCPASPSDMGTTVSTAQPVAQLEDKPVKSSSPSYPGALIVVEGIDGSGKSTQLYLLKRWLEVGGYRIHFTEWNSSPLVRSATRRGKQRRMLTPLTFSLIHAADFADRYERQILPLLRAAHVVLADRWVYTAFARDGARGCPVPWLRNLYRFAAVPNITFYFRAPLDVAVGRILSGRPRLKYYEAGMDLGLSLDRANSFRIFQGKILERYDQMVQTDSFVLMDGTLPVHQLQEQMREIVSSKLDLKRYG